MGDRLAKLTAIRVRTAKEPGRYGDGNGLFLEVGKSGSRSWILRVQANGKRRDIGLGSAAYVSLSEARAAVADIRRAIREGRDPVAEKRAAKAERIPTFREAAVRAHGEHMPSWKNPKHAAQWFSTLEHHVFPKLGNVLVSDVTSAMVRDVLSEIWLIIPETARRVRQRIGTVLDWAHAKGWREAEAPLRAISRGLPKQPKKGEHFAAMPWAEVPNFLVNLAGTPKAGEPVRLALEFLILTAVRSGELRGARWGEFNLQAKQWLIPAKRMKSGKAHTVPLSGRAMAILHRMKELRTSEHHTALVFEGAKPGRPISDMTLTMLLRRMGRNCTAHGFRSSFRDWAAEATNFPREVAEAALAHSVADRVEVAYRRSDLLEKWATYCAGSGGKVLALARRKTGF